MTDNQALEFVNSLIENKGLQDGKFGAVINGTHLIVSYNDNEVIEVDINDEDMETKVSIALNEFNMENFGIKDFITDKSSQFIKNQLNKGKTNNKELTKREDQLKTIKNLAAIMNKTKGVDDTDAKLFKLLSKMYAIVNNRYKKLKGKLSTKLMDKLSKTPEQLAKDDVSDKARAKNLDQALALAANYSELLEKISNIHTTNFASKKVKDSKFGVVFEDKFGSLWETDPDTDPDAKLLWESKRGKTSPLRVDEADKLSEQKDDEDLDLEGGANLNEEENLDLGGDDLTNDEDLNLEGEEGLEGELGGDEGIEEPLDSEGDVGESVDTPLDESSEQTATESLGQSLDKSLDTIKSMYNKLAKIVEG